MWHSPLCFNLNVSINSALASFSGCFSLKRGGEATCSFYCPYKQMTQLYNESLLFEENFEALRQDYEIKKSCNGFFPLPLVLVLM
jgi:hypothetical protein